jgi:hypothetical protein
MKLAEFLGTANMAGFIPVVKVTYNADNSSIRDPLQNLVKW